MKERKKELFSCKYYSLTCGQTCKVNNLSYSNVNESSLTLSEKGGQTEIRRLHLFLFYDRSLESFNFMSFFLITTQEQLTLASQFSSVLMYK